MPPAFLNTLPLLTCTKQACRIRQPPSRYFSSSPIRDARTTRARRRMWGWLRGPGANFHAPLEGSTNYLGAYTREGQLKRVLRNQTELDLAKQRAEAMGEDPAEAASQLIKKWKMENPPIPGLPATDLPPEANMDLKPFPMNTAFSSHKVTSGKLREEVWCRIMLQGKSVREVSAEMGIEMARVGAIVRLKEVEKEWNRMGKPVAGQYHEAVMKMLPKTMWNPDPKRLQPGWVPTMKQRHQPDPNRVKHEAINNLPVHRATGQQIFHPTSESRHFTRADAAKVFDDNLLPADARVPHPELAIAYKEQVSRLPPRVCAENAETRRNAENDKMTKTLARKAKKEAAIKKVETKRFEFQITDINIDRAGSDGRGHKGVGWRYGVPLMDRSRGQLKIPASV